MAVLLQIQVIGTDSKPATNAQVVVKPGDVSARTDASGRASLQVPAATKYTVSVTRGGEYASVPLYLSPGQKDANLNVNLAYLRSTKQLTTPPHQGPGTGYVVGAALGALIVLIVIVVIAGRLRGSRKSKSKAAR